MMDQKRLVNWLGHSVRTTVAGPHLNNQTLVGYRFRIEGHTDTDTVGSREYNNALSDLRAAAVVDYLANNFRVDRNRVEAIGMGKGTRKRNQTAPCSQGGMALACRTADRASSLRR
jgi:outer membrane protein OmpA-like peptidoglycan-associated protein